MSNRFFLSPYMILSVASGPKLTVLSRQKVLQSFHRDISCVDTQTLLIKSHGHPYLGRLGLIHFLIKVRSISRLVRERRLDTTIRGTNTLKTPSDTNSHDRQVQNAIGNPQIQK